MIRFIDLFCGIGGFRLGLEKANDSVEKRIQQRIRERGKSDPSIKQSLLGTKQFHCVWSCDINKYARQIYEKNFGEEPAEDITKIPAESIPDHDLLCAGFPCQSFSIAGKRKGFEDTRGTLFFEICRVLRVKRPSYCLLENVKGLLSHDNGKTFETILESLDELGYDCQWQILNSKHFGVPQNRERVFIIGHLRGKPRLKIFPITETGSTYSEGDEGGNQVSSTGQNLQSEKRQAESSSRNSRFNPPPDENLAREMIFEMGIVSTKKWLEDGKELSRNFPQGQRVYNPKGISAQINSQGGGWGAKTGLYELDDGKIRRLTPVECERLQGFPDGWTEGISDTQRYKCLGNAVTVNVIEYLGQRLAQECMKI